MKIPKVVKHEGQKIFFFDRGFTARQDYFTHFEQSQS